MKSQASRVADYLDSNSIEIETKARLLAHEISEVSKHKGTVWIAGNGGSASIANHFATDLSLISVKQISAISLSSNSSLITAIGNDFGFENIYSHQLAKNADSKDLLVLISSSGNSTNILKTLEQANKLEIRHFTITGFDGGALKSLSKNFFHLKSRIGDYGPTEDIHAIFCHQVRANLSI